MKQCKFLALAAGTLLLASCANEDIAEPKGDGNVTFTLQMPGDLGTRDFGDGTKAKDLYFAVYEHESTTPIIVSEAEYHFTGLTTTVNLKLVNGKNYDIIWWAQSPDVDCYTFKPEEQSVEISYTGIASNDENRDAFFQHTTTGVINAAFNQTVKLYRPFAQLNFGTDDLDEPAVTAAFNTVIDPETGLKTSTDLRTQVTTSAYSKLNLLNEEATKEVEAQVFGPNTPCLSEAFPVAGYDYLNMNYILMTKDQQLNNLDFTVLDATGKVFNTITIPNVPLQRNYRTNIYGQLLTSTADYNIEIVKNFEEPDYDINYVPVNNEADFVKAFNNAKDNDVLVLNNDVTIPGTTPLVANADMEINLGDNTLNAYALKVGEGKTLKIQGGNLNLTKTGNTMVLDFQGDNSAIELENVKMNTAAAHAIYFRRNTNTDTYNNNTLRIKDSEIISTGAFAISVGAGVGTEAVTGCSMELSNSTFSGDETAIVNLQNIPVTATNCTFNGTWHAVLFRSGTLDATNCVFNLNTDGSYPTAQAKNYPARYSISGGSGFGSANDATIGCVVIGSRGYNDYNAWPTSAKLVNCTANVTGANAAKYASVYVVSTLLQQTSFNYEGGNIFSGYGFRYNNDYGTTALNGGWIKINGTEYIGAGAYTE